MSDSRLEIILAAKDLTAQVFAGVEHRAKALFTRVTSLQGAVLGLAGVGGIGAVASGFLSTARAFERYETQLKTITGSSQAARASMDWIVEFTRTTPYELDQVTGAFVKLQAYGLDGTKWMRTLGDTASAMGKGLDQAVEMFADAVTGEFERLKEFGVKASSEGDRVTFRWSQNGRDMQLTTEKTATGISNALGRIFSRFTGGMEEQAKTFDGILSNLGDTWTSIQREFMDAGVFEEIKRQIADVNSEAGAWLATNRELIATRVPEYLQDTKTALQGIWDVISYDPAILEWGLVGFAVYGRKGAVVVGGLAHLYQAIANTAEGIKAAAAGQIEFSQLATANYTELKRLLDDIGKAPTLDTLRDRAAALREEIAEIERRTRGGPFHFREDLDDLQRLRAELSQVDAQIRGSVAQSEQRFRGMEMRDYGLRGAKRPTAVPAAVAAAGDVSAADLDKVDDALDKYFGKILDKYDAAIRDAKKLNADYWRALAEVRGDYYVDPERARWEGGQGQKAYAQQLIEDGERAMGTMEQLADRTSYSMQNAFAEFFDASGDGFLELESLATGVAGSIQRALTDALASWVVGEAGGAGKAGSGLLGLLFSAKGNVFDGGLVPFAAGGIVSCPTVFPFARGIGLMGEAGPEAIMPLARTPGGELGVRSQGGGGAVNVFVQAADAKSFDDMISRNPGSFLKAINKAIAYNGSTRSIIRRTTR